MLLGLIVKILILTTLCQAMTMKQIKATGKTIRKTCQPKNNVEDEKIDPLGKGVFIAEKEVMCYMACVMKMAGTVKNGKLSIDAAAKQIDMLLPPEIKEPAKAALTACKKVQPKPVKEEVRPVRATKIYLRCDCADEYKDICEAAFHVTKCIYNENPEIFYFP